MKVKQLYIIARKILALVMIALLVFLTSINLFIYSGSKLEKSTLTLIADTEEGGLPGNTGSSQPDEKVPDRPVSVSEEYVHEMEEIAQLTATKLIHTLLLIDKKIAPVHFELITPPPDLAI